MWKGINRNFALTTAAGLLLLMLAQEPVAATVVPRRRNSVWGRPRWTTTPTSLLELRGGDADATTTATTEERSLDEKVAAAMKKLGLSPPAPLEEEEDTAASDPQQQGECQDGVCPVTPPPLATAETTSEAVEEEETDPHVLAARICADLKVDESLAMAALGATAIVEDDSGTRRWDEAAARDMIQQEITFIESVSKDCEEVQTLVSEGHDVFFVRRALAFAEMNVEDARAILQADQMDAEEEERAQAQASAPPPPPPVEKPKPPVQQEMKTVTVNSNFDPTQIGAQAAAAAAPAPPAQPKGAPPPAKKEDVVFEATSATVQELVLESPVPVLLDVYADWCGPCKALTPVLEEMAVKGGGMFRLVKINSDNERSLSGALEVTSLPTVFGIRDGKIIHMFEGMPRGEQAMQNFMMGLLMPGATFDPPLTEEQKKKYLALSSKLAKTAGAAGFSFSARERLQDRMATRLDDVVASWDGDMGDAEESGKVIRSLLSNIIRDPFDPKFRKVNLKNKVVAAKVGSHPPCIAILKGVGFVKSADGNTMELGKGKKVVNVAPLTVARDCIDKWIDQNRNKIAAANRRRKDEIARKQLEEERALAGDDKEEEEEEEEEEGDPNATTIRVRMEGKKKVHEIALQADDPLSAIVEALPQKASEEEEVQLTCAAKRLVIKSTDPEAMQKSLREHGLFPAASVVVKIGDRQTGGSGNSLAERAAARKQKKKGSNTMQSIGLYAKDDNNKAELFDSGGVCYEHDVSDSEDEEEKEDEANDEENSEEPEENDDDDA